MLEAFRPGRERERDKAQLLSPTRQPPEPAKVENSVPGYLHQPPVTGPGPVLNSEPSSLSA